MTQKIEANKILKSMFSTEGIYFDDNKGWDALAEHVAVHNQYLNMTLNYNVSWDDALFSWYENVYTPLRREVLTRRNQKAFPTKTSGDLYLEMSDHWFYLKEVNENISAESAADDFIYKNRDRKNLLSKMFHTKGAHNTNYNRPKAA